MGLRFRGEGLGCRGLGFRASGDATLGLSLWGLRASRNTIEGSEFRGLGYRVQGLGLYLKGPCRYVSLGQRGSHVTTLGPGIYHISTLHGIFAIQ